MPRHRGGRGGARFVKFEYWLIECAAWKNLSANARASYLEIKKRYNGQNNGKISMSVRELAVAFDWSISTAWRTFQELEGAGFIEAVSKSGFNVKTRRASVWLLTEEFDNRNNAPAKKTFMKAKNQNTVS